MNTDETKRDAEPSPASAGSASVAAKRYGVLTFLAVFGVPHALVMAIVAALAASGFLPEYVFDFAALACFGLFLLGIVAVRVLFVLGIIRPCCDSDHQGI